MSRVAFPGKEIVEGLFVARRNRFLASVMVDGQEVFVHVPNSGRMKELLTAGAQVVLLRKNGANRKTAFELLLVRYEGYLVAIDSRLPNKIVRSALESAFFEQFSAYQLVQPEHVYGISRFDFYLPGEPSCLIEVKSVTLVENGRAFFPDAPTERGRKHLRELIGAVGLGFRCAVIFIIQRPDALSFSPNDRTDLEFGEILRKAVKEGVETYAYTCCVEQRGMKLLKAVPVVL